MTSAISAHNEDELRAVAAAAHDLWFRLEDITYNDSEQRVSVALTKDEVHRGRFGSIYYTRSDTAAGTLVFEGIGRLTIIDEAQADAYEVSSIVAQTVPGAVRITVFGGAPLRIEMEAARVAVRFYPSAAP